ncbi:MAG TPA: hypothetical protein PLX06_15800, partial [Fimbriimonadaceae bacterium]|nr:hypothetical protein [Fimbriimonadaceae bacterium]
IQLSGPTDEVKPGMFARGVVTLSTVEGATVVPSGAILRDGEKTYLFVKEGGVAKRVEVRTGLRSNGNIQVQNLPAGAEVVIDGQGQLTDGAKVRIDDGKAADTKAGEIKSGS